MLSIIRLSVFRVKKISPVRSCHYAECYNGEFHKAQCRGAIEAAVKHTHAPLAFMANFHSANRLFGRM